MKVRASHDKVGIHLGNDSNTLNGYFELGWEMGTTYRIVHEHYPTATIVTCKGREFLYEKSETDKGQGVDLDLSGMIAKNHKVIYEYGCNKPYTDWKPSIKPSRTGNYACVTYRNRKHAAMRNDGNTQSNIDTALEFVDKVYVVGYGAEKLKRCEVLSLKDWCGSLPNSKFVIGTLTGTMVCASLFSKCPMFVYDLAGNRKNTPMQMGDCITVNKDITFNPKNLKDAIRLRKL